MPVPVPPPEPPVIIESVVVEATGENTATLAQFDSAKGTALPSPPETFAPEYSTPPTLEETAAALGEPISVGLAREKRLPAPVPTLQNPVPNSASVPAQKQALPIPDSAPQETVPTPISRPQEIVPTPISSADRASPETNTAIPRAETALRSGGKPRPQQILIPSLTERRSGAQAGGRYRFLTQERGGETHEFEMTLPAIEPPPQEPHAPRPLPPVEIDPEDIVEITSDRQEYDQKRGIVTAQGNVVMRFSKGVLSADRVQVNLRNRIVVAEGNVALKRGDQILRGEKFEYFFVQDRGVIYNASGEIYQPNVGRDAAPTISDSTVLARPLSDRLLAEQPLQGVSAAEGYQFTVGGIGPNTQGTTFPSGGQRGQLNRQRFEAARVDFDGEVWRGTDVRLTNDPFSPPELEVRADTATVRNIGPLQDELVLDNPRLVFDQGLALPLFPRRFVFDRRDRDPALFTIGYDEDERGGVFIERSFDIYRSDRVSFQLTPQYLVQRSIWDGKGIQPNTFGLRSALDVRFSDRTFLTAKASLSSLELDNYQNRLRFNAKLGQQIDILKYPHTLTLEGNYRDRLFNGSLGFQTVQSSFGAVLTSPTIALGNTGLLLNYQAGVQFINADTDRIDLLPVVRDNNRINLTRYQGAAFLTRYFPLWVGKPLPATPDQGLRFTPVPVVPNVQLVTQLTGVSSYYSSGDTQPSITGSIGLIGQIGHFSRPLFDYTGFNITYTEGIRGAASPFLFDRFVDTRTLSFGLTQQIYGPFRFGFQSSVNLNTGQEISTDYIFEYSRRTHNILVRYNPVLGLAAISLRISDFNWNGSPQPFGGSGVRSVEQGVIR
jgi:lipopolysaccharide export system protein LptA